MNITELTSRVGTHPKRKRVGRGEGSGSGKTCGRGHKGAGARAGHRAVSLAEGGMFPLFRRLPKFGFNNADFRTDYQIVNVSSLEERFENGGHITGASLEEAGLVRDPNKLIKILGEGNLSKALTVEAHRFSGSAVAKIEGAGGTVKWLAPKPKKKFVKRPKVEADKAPKAKSGAKAKTKEKTKPKAEAKPPKKKAAPKASDDQKDK